MQNFGFIFLLFVVFSASAQKQAISNSLHPASSVKPGTVDKHSSKKKYYEPKRAKSNYRKPRVTHTAQYEFYERVEKAAKEKQRILRKLSKRAYSDPRYFGHKKLPKKRPPHKMRFCGECQIRH